MVLLDLILPQKQGFDVLEELKKSPITRSIPVIILTMLGRDDEAERPLSEARAAVELKASCIADGDARSRFLALAPNPAILGDDE